MIKDIRFRGMTSVTSDYDSPDGELALCHDCIFEDGAIRPIASPVEVIRSPFGTPVYQHKIGTRTMLILYDKDAGRLYYSEIGDKQGNGYTIIDTSGEDIELIGISSIGNTLLALSPKGMHYILWSGNGSYKYLGTKIPELPISFSLGGGMNLSSERLDNSEDGHLYSVVSALANKEIARITKEGRFIFPFFVRYALRLYDGSTTMPSAPVLMIPSDGMDLHKDKDGDHRAYLYIYACKLIMRAFRLADDIENWSDIVRGVDVFVSAPIYYYDQNNFANNVFPRDEQENYTISSFTNVSGEMKRHIIGRHEVSPTTRSWKHWDSNGKLWTGSGNDRYWLCISTIHKKAIYETDKVSSFSRALEQVSNFYLLHHVPLSSLSFSRRGQIITLPEGYLSNLTSYETLKDDYQSHDLIIPKIAFPYNARLNLAGVSRRILPRQGSLYMIPETYSDEASLNEKQDVKIIFRIKGEDNIEHTILGHHFKGTFTLDALSYLYCPYPRCSKAYVLITDIPSGVMKLLTLEMKQHDFLSGSYAYSELFPSLDRIMRAVTSSDLDTLGLTNLSAPEVNMPNKLYTSEVNNPFLFPATGINTVGTGTILGISSATKALSQGQFGQFPLYVFSTDGIWTLEVAKDGTFITKQPVTRDVCTSPKSITQTDTGVLFISDRGVMLISGSESVCISEDIYSVNKWHRGVGAEARIGVSPSTLPHIDRILPDIHGDIGEGYNMTDFLAGAEIIYVYSTHRVVLFNRDDRFKNEYVYSIKGKCWATTKRRASAKINSYPEALALSGDYVIDYGQVRYDADDRIYPTIITRPIKLDSPDTLKTIRAVILRGVSSRDTTRAVESRGKSIALYGSVDLVSWTLVRASRGSKYLRGMSGTPYKYFCIVTTMPSGQDACIESASVEFYPKYANKLR